jgi:Cu/Ag efflux protein CusF
MFKTVTARALLGVAALGVAGGATALAASPSPSTAAPMRAHKDAGDRAAGTIIKLSDQQMTVVRVHRDPKTKATIKDDATFALRPTTAVYRFGSKGKLGLDSLKVGQQVAVRFTSDNSLKAAKVVVIRPDHRAGRIVSKDPDGKSFTIKTRDGSMVHVTTSDKTRYVEGWAKHRQSGSYADLKVGDRVLVLGQEDSQHLFDALVVRSARADRAASPQAAPTP